jgi:hypothetical protein
MFASVVDHAQGDAGAAEAEGGEEAGGEDAGGEDAGGEGVEGGGETAWPPGTAAAESPPPAI